jgi:hypothetical protein
MSTDTLFILGIVFVFGILPLLFFGGIQAAIVAIGAAPHVAQRFGFTMPPLTARLIVAALIFVPLYVLWPDLALFIGGLAVVFLPVAIAGCLLIAILCGFAARDEGFGSAFWRVAAPVPLLCGAFVVAAIPVAIAKKQAIEAVSRPSVPR